MSLYSCGVVERRPNLVISTSHGLLHFAGNYAIGNIQVCYADALPVSIV
jgi:hypothetical protein